MSDEAPWLSERELATVLAGLRTLQRFGTSNDILEIATNGGELVPLNLGEIDDLCERINC